MKLKWFKILKRTTARAAMRITAITTEKATIKIPQQPQQLPQQLLKNVNANRALLGLKVNAYRAVQTNNTTKRKGSASV
jgi:hypothetical protein